MYAGSRTPSQLFRGACLRTANDLGTRRILLCSIQLSASAFVSCLLITQHQTSSETQTTHTFWYIFKIARHVCERNGGSLWCGVSEGFRSYRVSRSCVRSSRLLRIMFGIVIDLVRLWNWIIASKNLDTYRDCQATYYGFVETCAQPSNFAKRLLGNQYLKQNRTNNSRIFSDPYTQLWKKIILSCICYLFIAKTWYMPSKAFVQRTYQWP